MKEQLIFLAVLIVFFKTSTGQVERNSRNSLMEGEREHWHALSKSTSTVSDTTIDVTFYHIDVTVAVDSQYICGSVYIELRPKTNNMVQFNLDLQSALIVDSVALDAISHNASYNRVTIGLTGSFDTVDVVKVKVYYHGIPALANGMKGLVYSTHGNGEPLIATLSTPFLSHFWWPCNDGPQDKADSVYIDITVKDTVVNGIPLIAVSNGVLTAIDSSTSGYKTFEWKHRYPVVPYYVMMAISNYKIIDQTYSGATSSFPLIYYVFDAQYNQALAGVAKIPDAIDCFSDLFGDYPFKNEKYGMTQLGFYGAIENQTNTVINTMDSTWFYISVHELSHMWFGDMITCSNWHHAWLNEGFATYAEALMYEYQYGFAAYKSYIGYSAFYEGGTVYLQNDTSAFNIFIPIIYQKGSYILHMLRGILGDTVFFDCLYAFANTPEFKYQHASTEDFRQICESVSGMDLHYFFDQWIYDQYYPKYRYNFKNYPSNHSVAITIIQNQGPSNGWRAVFKMPLDLKLHFSTGNDTLIRVLNDQQNQTYLFSLQDSVTSVIIDPNNWVLKKSVFDPGIYVSGYDFTARPHRYKLYPNPTKSTVSIVTSQKVEGTTLTIYSMSMQEITCVPLKDNISTVDMGPLSCGVYVFAIKNPECTELHKIVKE